MSTIDTHRLTAYANLLVRAGVNLQPGQSLFLRAELEHAHFARLVLAAAYDAGARYVHIIWTDDPSFRNRLLHSQHDHLDYVPEFDIARLRQGIDEGWASITLVGSEFPDILADVDPSLLRRVSQARVRKTKFYGDAQMSHLLQWNIAAVPTRAWAMQVFPNLEPDDAINRLWEVILSVVRADAPDPLAAWQQHDQQLSLFAAYLKQSGVRALHFLDSQPGPDSKPRTDLMVGLSDAPVWIAASTSTPAGVRFLPNIPTEELFTTPHRERVDGWMRTTKPAFPFGQRIDDIYLRFEKGAVVEFDAASGRNALQEFLSAPGADRPGEIALVDVRSPVNRSGLLFYETLLDENCVAHIALGMAYPDGVEHGSSMMEHERTAAGINDAMVHLDLMIGSATMDVSGVTMAGAHLPIMHNGQFVDALLQTSQTAHA